MDLRKQIELTKMYSAAQKAKNATEEEKDAAIRKAHDYVCLGYTLINAADIIMRKTPEIMEVARGLSRYEDSFHLGEAMKGLERVIDELCRSTEHMDSVVCDIHKDGYDRMRNNANEVLRFVMLLYDRTTQDDKATNQLGAYMQRMKSHGLFSEEEIASFKMR